MTICTGVHYVAPDCTRLMREYIYHDKPDKKLIELCRYLP